MFTGKNLNEEMKELKGRLERLERRIVSQQIGEVQKANQSQKANHKLEQVHQKKIKKLLNAHQKLDKKLTGLQAIAAVLFAIFSGVAVFYIDQYRRNVDQYQKYEVARGEAYEVLVDVLQNRLGDTIDRISLLTPNREDRMMVVEVYDMQQKLSHLDISSKKLAELSTLTNALKLKVNENNAEEASALLTKHALADSEDRFIASRALVLQAAARFSEGFCTHPESTEKLVKDATERDSGVVAAFSLWGVCQAENAKKQIEAQPAQVQANSKFIQDALRNIELAFQFKPTRWSKARYLNNKVWDSLTILSAALKQKMLADYLPSVGHNEIEAFFRQSLKDIKECIFVDQRHATYLETEAELHGFEYTYYKSDGYRNADKATTAYNEMITALTEAIGKGLLVERNKTKLDEAEKYFWGDELLKPLFANPDDPHTLDAKIKVLIKQ